MKKKRRASESRVDKTEDEGGIADKLPAKKTRRASESRVDKTEDEGGIAEQLPVEDILGDGGEVELKVSEKFAKKYNEKKNKEELSKNKKLLEDEDSDSYSASSEDEGAELLTSKVECKIFETLQKIKSKDPAIYNQKHVFFGDEDFEESKTPSASSKASAASTEKKSVKYKDFLRETLLRDGADYLGRGEEELERMAKRKTPNEEQHDIKNSLLRAAHDDGDEDDGFDLFAQREKTEDEKKREDQEYEEFMKSKAGRRDEDGEEIISRYWKADENLDDSEQFLRDFIINKGWNETGSIQEKSWPRRGFGDEIVPSSEDEADVEEMDEFEKDYNFRFEADEGGQIKGHKRFPENSVRERKDKRKQQRQSKAERQEADKIRRTEELKRLKNLKKEEISRRLKQLQEITGNDETTLGSMDLDGEFDPDTHDKQMVNMLGQDYDEREDGLTAEELAEAPAGMAELDVSNDGKSVPAVAKLNAKAATAEADGDADAAADGAEANGDEEDEEVDDQTWWLCDMCGKGIPAGKRRFDCAVCENFSLCAKCFRVRKHPHKFVKKRVPYNAKPPVDFKGEEAAEGNVADAMDEYFQLDYEDIIGGDLPTRFKYRKVEKNSYGLTPQDLLNKSDQELNRVIPLKKLRTYKNDWVGDRVENDTGTGKGKGKGKGKDESKGKGKGKGGRGGSFGHRHKKAAGDDKIGGARLAAYNFEGDRGTNRQRDKKGKKEG